MIGVLPRDRRDAICAPMTGQRMSRRIAGLAAVAAWLSLVAQAVVSHRLMGQPDLTTLLWRMAGYFTVLTNVAVAVAMTSVAAGHPLSARMAGAAVSAILVVGIVYHAVLAALWQPEGLAWWADQGLHTAVPVLTAIWWIGFARKAPLTLRDAAVWLVWPMAYLGYAIIRQTLTGFAPYPFLDLKAHQPMDVALNVLAIVGLFVGVSAILLAVARITRR
jgi:small-conductance mechanosensitive channel